MEEVAHVITGRGPVALVVAPVGQRREAGLVLGPTDLTVRKAWVKRGDARSGGDAGSDTDGGGEREVLGEVEHLSLVLATRQLDRDVVATWPRRIGVASDHVTVAKGVHRRILPDAVIHTHINAAGEEALTITKGVPIEEHHQPRPPSSSLSDAGRGSGVLPFLAHHAA